MNLYVKASSHADSRSRNISEISDRPSTQPSDGKLPLDEEKKEIEEIEKIQLPVEPRITETHPQMLAEPDRCQHNEVSSKEELGADCRARTDANHVELAPAVSDGPHHLGKQICISNISTGENKTPSIECPIPIELKPAIESNDQSKQTSKEFPTEEDDQSLSGDGEDGEEEELGEGDLDAYADAGGDGDGDADLDAEDCVSWEGEGDADSEAGWIGPDNFHAALASCAITKSGASTPLVPTTPSSDVRVACLTSDFAMQVPSTISFTIHLQLIFHVFNCFTN